VNTISSPHEIPADVRQVIVRQMALALANAWRRQHEGVKAEDLVQKEKRQKTA
jgi:hypothetical protein